MRTLTSKIIRTKVLPFSPEQSVIVKSLQKHNPYISTIRLHLIQIPNGYLAICRRFGCNVTDITFEKPLSQLSDGCTPAFTWIPAYDAELKLTFRGKMSKNHFLVIKSWYSLRLTSV